MVRPIPKIIRMRLESHLVKLSCELYTQHCTVTFLMAFLLWLVASGHEAEPASILHI